MLLFALEASRSFGEGVAAALGLPLARHEEREFEDGEHKARPLESVRGRDVFVVHSLYSDGKQSVNDKICRLLFFIGALKDASARRVCAVIPYFAYARKDRKTQPRDPVTMKYLARLLEAAGADHVLAMDVHNLAAFQNAFRIPTDYLEARVLFAPRLAELAGREPVTVVSPDAGGIKRAERLRQDLSELLGREAGLAFLEKWRGGGRMRIGTLAGDVESRTAVIVDDLVSSGATLARAAEVLEQKGAARVLGAATHGLFNGPAAQALAQPALERLLVSNTVPAFRLAGSPAADKLLTLDAAPLFAEAVRRIHENGSVTGLLLS